VALCDSSHSSSPPRRRRHRQHRPEPHPARLHRLCQRRANPRRSETCDPGALRPRLPATWDAWMGRPPYLGPAEEDGRGLAVLFWPDQGFRQPSAPFSTRRLRPRRWQLCRRPRPPCAGTPAPVETLPPILPADPVTADDLAATATAHCRLGGPVVTCFSPQASPATTAS
jgi:hypothetical protein